MYFLTCSCWFLHPNYFCINLHFDFSNISSTSSKGQLISEENKISFCDYLAFSVANRGAGTVIDFDEKFLDFAIAKFFFTLLSSSVPATDLNFFQILGIQSWLWNKFFLSLEQFFLKVGQNNLWNKVSRE